MKNIGFKNFRKYKDFKPIEFAPFTIFVGGNNAGKSTVVKAMLALKDYMMYQSDIVAKYEDYEDVKDPEGPKLVLPLISRFRFDGDYYTHLGTFNRSLCNDAETKNICFSSEFDDWLEFEVNIEEDGDEESTSGRISFVRITDLVLNVVYHIDLNENKIVITINDSQGKYYQEKLKMIRGALNDPRLSTKQLDIWQLRLCLYEIYYDRLQSIGGGFKIETAIYDERNHVVAETVKSLSLYQIFVKVANKLRFLISKKGNGDDNHDWYSIYDFLNVSPYFLSEEPDDIKLSDQQLCLFL